MQSIPLRQGGRLVAVLACLVTTVAVPHPRSANAQSATGQWGGAQVWSQCSAGGAVADPSGVRGLFVAGANQGGVPSGLRSIVWVADCVSGPPRELRGGPGWSPCPTRRGYDPPLESAELVLRRPFPWAPAGAPVWPASLWATGRLGLTLTAQGSPDWMAHHAPLVEWHGHTVPRRPLA